MKRFRELILLLSLFLSIDLWAGPTIFGGDNDVEPFPWGSPCAFDMSDFTGVWKAKAFDGIGTVYYEITVNSSEDLNLVQVTQYRINSRGLKQILLSGAGQFVAGGEQINVGLLPVESYSAIKRRNTEPNYVYLYFGSYCSLQGGRTYIVSRQGGEGAADEDESNIELERVGGPSHLGTQNSGNRCITYVGAQK